MKASDFNAFFLKAFPTTVVIQKKPSVLFKRYLYVSRVGHYYSLNFTLFFSILRRVVFFLQNAASGQTLPVFFLDNPNFYALYKNTTGLAGAVFSYVPCAINWASNWGPAFAGASRHIARNAVNGVDSGGTVVSGFGIFCETKSLLVPYWLALKGWPLILCASLREPSKDSFLRLQPNGFYLLPTQQYGSVTNHYFLLAFFCKVLAVERLRVAV